MKKSQLKEIIRECIEELNEVGPARKHRKATGYQYKDGLDDPLNNPVKDRKDWAIRGKNISAGAARNMVKVQSTQYARKRPAGDNRYRGKFGSDDYIPRKSGSFKKLGEANIYSGAEDDILDALEKDSLKKNRYDKKYPPVGKPQNLKRGQPLRVKSPAGQKVRWDSKSKKWIDEGIGTTIKNKYHKVNRERNLKAADKSYKSGIDAITNNDMKKFSKMRHKELIKIAKAVNHKAKIKEEKKYHTSPPLKGFNRSEPMAYKKNSLSGKIASGLRKVERTASKLKNESSWPPERKPTSLAKKEEARRKAWRDKTYSKKTEYGSNYKQSIKDLKAGKTIKKVTPKKKSS